MSTFLSNLPDITFAEKEPAVIEAEVFARFEKKLGRKLHPSDPWRQVLLNFIYYLVRQRSNIDYAGKQNLLKYAGEGFLQNLGALLGVEINEPSAAVTRLEFLLSIALPSSTIIPQGTRATPGNNIYFATTDDVEINGGELSVIAPAECIQAGAIGNGYLPGQVNRLVDTFPFHYTVRNIDTTQGGADREGLDSLRERIRIRPESFSTAGPYGAYIYWAKTASQLIIDVSVKSPSPGVVEIIPLLEGGELPTQALLDDVYKVCNADNRRPLTDMVVVRKPEVVKYKINLVYFIARSNAAFAQTIQDRFDVALNEFMLWQKSALGRDINPSQLTKMVMKAGIKRVEIVEPLHRVLQYYELGVADIDNIIAINGGLEDD